MRSDCVCARWAHRASESSCRAPRRRRRPDAVRRPDLHQGVAPILFGNCTGCHRPGEIGPMSLLTYDDVRPRAKAIRDKISEGAMPPWHADMPHGTFLNERGLTDAEKSDDLPLGCERRAAGRSEGHAIRAEYPERLVDRQTRRRLRDAGRVQGPRRRRDPVPSSFTFRRTSPSRNGFRPSRYARAIAMSSITCSCFTRRSRICSVRPVLRLNRRFRSCRLACIRDRMRRSKTRCRHG